MKPEALRELEPGYAPICQRAVAVFEADERVRALWLSPRTKPWRSPSCARRAGSSQRAA